MTIQLTAPIFVAGAHQPIGTSLTLGVAREAELVNRGVAIYTSRALAPGEGLTPAMLNAAGTALVGPDGVDIPFGIYMATVAIATDFVVPVANGANKVAWDGGLILNKTGASSIWSAGTPSRFTVPAGFTMARVTSALRVSDAFANQPYINHIFKNGVLTFNGVGIETGELAAAGPLNINSQTSWVAVIAGDYFETGVLNNHATITNTILATVRSWFQIELMK